MLKKLILIFDIIIITITANLYWIIDLGGLVWAAAVIPVFLFINAFPVMLVNRNELLRLRICEGGNFLLKAFIPSTVIGVILHILLLIKLLPDGWKPALYSCIVCFLVECVVFWNGIIRVYCTSVQLGLKARALGLYFGMVPIANLVMLFKIIKITSGETDLELRKSLDNSARKDAQVCKTKYPILLVHGVFFRDLKLPNYWGRIPKEFEKNGAVIYYGLHDSAASVADSGEALAKRIKSIVDETGCEKLNIIAHSKGGLDSRYAISCCGADKYVASLTTINTPHRGCMFADYLLEKIPKEIQNSIASFYNETLSGLGDKSPDFMAAVTDLTAKGCAGLNERMPDMPGVRYQSVGSKLNHARGGQFPLNFTYRLAKRFDGPNDGLVSAESCKWGEDFIMLTPPKKRGISHGDMIDLNRENISGFDVREFYVKLVAGLKEKGM